jgi:RNA ligase
MVISKKYSRTLHYPFSPGTTSDDRINNQYWQDIQQIKQIIHTEKLDGENNCLSKYGVFARSHVAPTESAWTKNLRQHWTLIKKQLGDLEIFGENLYAIHSIEYQRLEQYFYVFAIRENEHWLSWEEVKFYAALLEFPTVPELKTVSNPFERITFETEILALTSEPSIYGSVDILENKPCVKEGIVSRNVDSFHVDDFAKNVFKYVRKGHVKTNEHWTKNWKKAHLIWERGGEYVAVN